MTLRVTPVYAFNELWYVFKRREWIIAAGYLAILLPIALNPLMWVGIMLAVISSVAEGVSRASEWLLDKTLSGADALNAPAGWIAKTLEPRLLPRMERLRDKVLAERQREAI